ncbi:hypothetical protein [Nibribacter koreensis]|uniref:hypothetical protein n=1 Tax=Nibribacter koreensis TaxID=1084519 RepID=UPI0031ECE0EC
MVVRDITNQGARNTTYHGKNHHSRQRQGIQVRPVNNGRLPCGTRPEQPFVYQAKLSPYKSYSNSTS